MQSDLRMGTHVDNIAKICKKRLYLLTQLRKQGLSQSLLKFVFEAIVSSRITYLAPTWRGYVYRADPPAWRGYTSRADIDFIQKLFYIPSKALGNVNTDYNLENLLGNCDKALFVASQSSKHCLYSRFSKKDNQLLTMVL